MSKTDAPTEVPDALYNRYRPRKLSELVGQDHVVVPLRRAFEKGRIHHAYLLSGPRGCGKTSTARILAAGLVCENGPTADPCNVCDHCVQVIGGHHIDVIEMDAASNGGVDDARELREKAHFSPAVARFKVVVVDEAHMVTTAGFNALLKLIEEPPPHVRFIFATTNPEKMLGTIRSRTYNYGFRLVPAPALAAHIEKIVALENHTLEDGVLALILRAGGGSMRDSLAVLGQLLDGSAGGVVRLDEAAGLLGATADTVLDNALEAIAARDTAALLGVIGGAIDDGIDPRRLTEDLLDRVRDLLLLATTGMLPPLAEIAGAQRQAAWRSITERLTTRGLTAAAEVLQTASSSASPQPRITLEVAAARILLTIGEQVDVNAALHSLAKQVADLPGRMGGGSVMPELYAGQPAAPQPSAPVSQPAPPTPAPVEAYEPPPTPQQTAPGGVVQNPGGMIGGVNNDFGPGGIHNTPLSEPTTPQAPAPEAQAPAPVITPEQPAVPVVQAPAAPHPLAGIGSVIEETPHAATEQPAVPTPQPVAPETPTPAAPAAPEPAYVPEPTYTPAPQQAAPPAAGWDTPAPATPVATGGDQTGSWDRLLEGVKSQRRFTWMVLQNAEVVAINNGRVVLNFANAGAAASFNKPDNIDAVVAAATEVLGGTWKVEVQTTA